MVKRCEVVKWAQRKIDRLLIGSELFTPFTNGSLSCKLDRLQWKHRGLHGCANGWGKLNYLFFAQ